MTLSLALLVFDGVDELDVIGPVRVFWALDDVRPYVPAFDDVTVHFVSESGLPVVAAHGLPLAATISYADCPSLDVLVVPGGGSDQGESVGRRFQQAHLPTLRFLQSQHGLFASVCTGAFVLAGSGRLDGHRVTTHWTAREELSRFNSTITVVPERLVDVGDVITSGGVTSGIDLGLHVVERILGQPTRTAVEMALEIGTPPGRSR